MMCALNTPKLITIVILTIFFHWHIPSTSRVSLIAQQLPIWEGEL